MPRDPQREAELVKAALAIVDAQARGEFLDRECAGDSALRKRVDALLKDSDEPRDALDQSKTVIPDLTFRRETANSVAADEIGAVIGGKYRLLEELGEGGMGKVFLAEQTQPVKRRVAIKLVRSGIDTAPVLARFDAERQAVALMDHPNIARVLDAGTTESGKPYFVMELVNGVPVTQFCDETKLSIQGRLRLFIPICSAVQHAHQKGVMHRDLKPSNILVESQQGSAVPKVIDFGLAKSFTGMQLTEKTVFTAIGAVAGTPLYMAPEQATLDAVDIDTRADVYALGVILYELLTGSTPIERARYKRAAISEMLRLIREEEPPTPSTRLRELETKTEVAAERQIEPARLGRLMRGELDWIVMKALAKERERRYESATAFASDIERYLNHEPVQAGPPTAAYRLRKFVQRNRGAVLAGALLIVALVAGIVGTTAGMIRAERLRKNAEKERDEKESARRAESEQRQVAEDAQRRAMDALRATTDSVIEQLIGSKPMLGPIEKRFIESVVGRWQAFASEKGESELARSIRAEGLFRVGKLRAYLGQRDQAISDYRQAVDNQEKLVADFPDNLRYTRDLAGSHNNLAVLLVDMGKPADSEEHYRRSLKLYETLIAQSPSEFEFKQCLARTQSNLGGLLSDLNRRTEAKDAYGQAISTLESLVNQFPTVPEYRHILAKTRINMGLLLWGMNHLPQAEEEYRKAIDLLRKLDAESPTSPEFRIALADCHNNYGLLLIDEGKPAETETEYREALNIEEKLADKFPGVPLYRVSLGGSQCNLANLLHDEKKDELSLPWFARSIGTLLEVLKQIPGDVTADQYICNAYAGRASALENLNRPGDALADWDRAIEHSSGAERSNNRLCRAFCRVRAGQADLAASDASDLVGGASADLVAGAACVFGFAYSRTNDERYAVKAIDLLRRAIDEGYKDMDRIKSDPNLESIRKRAEYKQFLAALEKKLTHTGPTENKLDLARPRP